jgi:hypothetical protein
MKSIINATPSRSTVDAALLGPVAFGQVVEVEDEDDRRALIATGHFRPASKAAVDEVQAIIDADAKAAESQRTTDTTEEQA